MHAFFGHNFVRVDLHFLPAQERAHLICNWNATGALKGTQGMQCRDIFACFLDVICVDVHCSGDGNSMDSDLKSILPSSEFKDSSSSNNHQVRAMESADLTHQRLPESSRHPREPTLPSTETIRAPAMSVR